MTFSQMAFKSQVTFSQMKFSQITFSQMTPVACILEKLWIYNVQVL
jgi:hypothetical protein